MYKRNHRRIIHALSNAPHQGLEINDLANITEIDRSNIYVYLKKLEKNRTVIRVHKAWVSSDKGQTFQETEGTFIFLKNGHSGHRGYNIIKESIDDDETT